MGDFQVRQKSARFYDQTETWADASLNTDGDIGFVETSSLSNKSFVYYGNSDVITMKNPMTLQFSSMYAYGAGGTGGWAAANWDLQSGGGSITDNQPSSTSEGSLVFTKMGSGGFGAGAPTWYCDQAFSPGSGFMNKLGPGKENDPFMIQSRNNTPQSGWIVGFIISEGGLNTTFTTATNGGGSSPFGTIAFDIITGSISTPTVAASNIHYYNFSNGTRTQRTMKTFRNAIRYDNITLGLGIRYKLVVVDPVTITDTNTVTILGNAILIELLVIEDVML